MSVKPSGLGPWPKAVYRAAAWAGHRLAPARARRRGAVEQWRRWAARDRGGPVVWIHAASVGEALVALPVLSRLRRAVPGLVAALTYTSPSAERWPGPWPVDRADYLPPDLPAPMRGMLDALRPGLLVYARADVWPELTARAVERGVPVAMIGATVGSRSGRLRWPVRPAFQPLYAALAYVGASTPADSARLARLGVRSSALQVTGDPRHDQVLERVPDGKVLRDLRDWAAAAEVMVAGSTEPPDEPRLLEALVRVRRRRPTAGLLVCPHDPGPQRSERLVAQARHLGLDAAVWRAGTARPGAPCLIVERAGVLADLYALGALAYVGGGLGSHGVHATIEAASCAIPVMVGPRGHGHDVQALLREGGAVALPQREVTEVLVRTWETWLADGAARTQAGLAARRTLSGGAAEQTVRRLLELISDRAY